MYSKLRYRQNKTTLRLQNQYRSSATSRLPCTSIKFYIFSSTIHLLFTCSSLLHRLKLFISNCSYLYSPLRFKPFNIIKVTTFLNIVLVILIFEIGLSETLPIGSGSRTQRACSVGGFYRHIQIYYEISCILMQNSWGVQLIWALQISVQICGLLVLYFSPCVHGISDELE